MRVFGEDGFHRADIDRITTVAGSSRATFYRYFTDKDDVFRHLAGQVTRQLDASIEALSPLTADAGGWATTRAWIARYADIYERYEPVFQAFHPAPHRDEAVAGGSVRTAARYVPGFRSRLATTTLPPRQLGPVISMLLECLPRTLDIAGMLRSATPTAYPKDRVEDALADVVHRTLFGYEVEVNAHGRADAPPPALSVGPVLRDAFQRDDVTPELNAAGRRSLAALMDAGRDVFVARGYHRTRIDDIVAAAGLSHGSFYRYFRSKDELARLLAVRAIRTVSTTLTEIPTAASPGGTAGTAALRRWLRLYNDAHATEAAVIRVWSDAALEDPDLVADSAAVLDWGRRRMTHVLRPRGFGDVEMEAIAMVALLSTFGAREQPAATVDAAAHIIGQGFYGR